MTRLLQSLKDLMRRPAAIRPGLYPFVRDSHGQVSRFFLRVHPSGDGLLLANAAAMARLNASGVAIAKGILDGDPLPTVVKRVHSLFRGVSSQQIAADVATVQSLIERMQQPGGGYPILNMADPAFSPKVAPLGRPISADVPLCPPFPMRQILERLWQQGIPHVTILVDREPEGETLTRAVERASDLGLITGVRGRGSDLAVGTRIADLAAAGLDHLDVLCLSAQESVHDALAGNGDFRAAAKAFGAAQKHEVCPVAMLPLVRQTLTAVEQTLETLMRRGLRDVASFAIATTDSAEADSGALSADELPPVAKMIEEFAERLGTRLLWYPTMRCDTDKALAEQVCAGPRCSGDMAIRVEPDGSVIAPRGPFCAAGNLIEDDWETIEHSEVFASYRRRITSDTHCDTCPGLAICAADCPRDPAGWAEGGMES